MSSIFLYVNMVLGLSDCTLSIIDLNSELSLKSLEVHQKALFLLVLS